MGIFNFFSKKMISTKEMISIVDKWTDIYMNQYTTQKNKDIENEIYLFNSWIVWDFCLNNNLMKNSREHGDEYIANIQYFINQTKNISPEEILFLYQNRYKIYKNDISGLLNSNYPKTKQFIPFSLYCAIYKNQYSHYPSENINMYDNLISDDLHEFTGRLIKYWNKVNSELITKHK